MSRHPGSGKKKLNPGKRARYNQCRWQKSKRHLIATDLPVEMRFACYCILSSAADYSRTIIIVLQFWRIRG